MPQPRSGDDTVATGPPPPDTRDGRFERALARLPNGVLVVDRDLTVEFVNAAARRLLGETQAPHPGDALPDVWPSFSLRELANGLFASRASGEARLVDVADRCLSVQGFPDRESNTVTVIVDDVTTWERQRRAEQSFIENAAHELRTPLAAIVSVIDVLETGAKDAPEARERFLRHLRVHSDRLARLAGSLLTLARIQAGDEKPHLELLSVGPLFEEIAADLRPHPGVEIVVRASDGPAVLADRELLHRVLVNVGANAAKYTYEGEIVFTSRSVGDKTELEVRDDGVGMSSADRDLAFDRFHRGAKSSGEGFGLGLAIAAEAVRALDGSIELESQPGRGTSVRIRLPSATIVS